MEIPSEDIRKHAIESYPDECVGFICNGEYHRLVNVSKHPREGYSLSLDDKLFLNRLGSLQGLVHSHPIMDSTPSNKDLAAQSSTGFIFFIIGTDGINTTEIREVGNAATST